MLKKEEGEKNPFKPQGYHFFAPEEVTEFITGEKWILRGHKDNSLTFGEDTLLSEEKKKKTQKESLLQWGIKLLVLNRAQKQMLY